jgi:ubiquinone biosynthesis monooxygenase Coq7
MSEAQHNKRLQGFDALILQLDQALRTLVPGSSSARRVTPAANIAETTLSPQEREHAAGLMRINHTGEVCAQALYQGQALTAKLPDIRAAMEAAAQEEVDHLAWCEQRLRELDSRSSYLNPLWYAMSFGLGAAAGMAGDRWSLGFVAETDEPLERLPPNDAKSQAVLRQMLVDENIHGETARKAGGAELPMPIQLGMKLLASVMKKTSYKI